MLVLKDRVQETSTTSGTGTLTLLGAVSGFQTFSTAIGNGNTTFYTIYDLTAYDWEVGIGTVGAGTLARTTVLSNSAGTTSPISFAGNVKSVFCTYPAEKSINYDADGVATIGEVLGYSDTGVIGSFASTVAGYNQVVVQNKSTATNASSNFNVSNDAGTAGSNYAELGINSSTFTGTGSFNIAGASYVASASTDLTIGTYGAYDIHFVTNSNTTDAMTIHDNGGISLGTFGNPGIKNIAASKFVPGYSAITSAAGTTVLTADSNYYQNLVGSTTQTFELPDATTLLVGTTFIFDNNSSGALTVVDNASGPIETIPGGAAGFIYLANNSTVAGSWNKHSFLPASYDFNITTANFGTATITNATWNGNTIGTAYGGTGLTTFGSANYALYSTSSSALVAGTLPVAAGGSGATTFTANGVLYGNGTSALGVTAAGTTGQVLIGNTGAAPSWGTVSSSLVSSFQTSLSGLTPSTATTGAVTLAGTLGISSGGTGQTTANTAFNALVPSQTSNTGKYLTTNGTDTSWAAVTQTTFSAGTTGFTPNTATSGTVTLAGTLNIANGGTGETTRQAAIDALAGAVTSGQYLRGNGTDVVMSAIQAADVPTLNQNTTGSSGSCTGNAATATNLTSTGANWSTNGVITAVVGQLAWKNYGNNHTIFDASASTAPNGSAVNNTNSTNAWAATYPTLMGWNGSQTYGVRVDSARSADNAIGVGQTWQNLTASRAAGTTYTNSTGRPIMVAITWNDVGGVTNAGFDFFIDGVNVASARSGGTGGQPQRPNISSIIPSGSTYSATSLVGALNKWFELR
jgi:hypothetical protein